jgi:hypothetical protein
VSTRKTAVHTTNADQRAAEFGADERRDRIAEVKARGAHPRTLLPSLAQWREERAFMSWQELWDVTRAAARLEMRGEMYSADDRLDCAASIVRELLVETGAADDRCTMPRRDSRRVTLTALRDRAKTMRRSLERQREHDAENARRAAEEYALTADALGVGTVADDTAEVARIDAERATDAVCAKLGLTASQDSPVWLTLYQWAANATAETVAEDRALAVENVRTRIKKGAKVLRSRHGLAHIAGTLTLGAKVARTPLKRSGIPAGTILLTLEDRSREAHSRTPLLAQDWREGTAAGSRPERPADASTARAECIVTQMSKGQKVHWRHRREHRADRAAQTAASLASIGREYARTARRERTAASTSDIARAQVNAA